MISLLDFKTIYKNLPNQPEWKGSFYERLVEESFWDEDEFWNLHYDLTLVAHKNQEKEMDRILAEAIVRIFIRVTNSISAHYNNNDIFFIKNLDDKQLFEFVERFNMAVMSAFSGEVIDESFFDLKNPLLCL